MKKMIGLKISCPLSINPTYVALVIAAITMLGCVHKGDTRDASDAAVVSAKLVIATPVPSQTPTQATPTLLEEPTEDPGVNVGENLDVEILASPDPSDPFKGLRIDDLAARTYGGPGIEIGEINKTGRGFTQYQMTYRSDGLKITGLVDLPDGQGPFPVIIVNHGYLRPIEYQSGFDSWRIADWLAQHGYIALMPDYRNYAGSGIGPNPFHIGYAVDIMNLLAQVDTLPQAASGQIGIMGHSMGGEISMWPMVLSNEVDAVVLYSSMSGDAGRNWAHARKYWPAQRAAMDALAMVYGRPDVNPQGYADISPINYLDQVRMPVMIHHGNRDESVPYWWSEDLWHKLQAANVDVTFYPYPGGGHALGGRGFETLMQRTLEFFDMTVRNNVNSPDTPESN